MGSNNLWLQGVSTILNQVVDGVEIEENRFALRNMPWWKYLEAINFASKWTRLKCKKNVPCVKSASGIQYRCNFK